MLRGAEICARHTHLHPHTDQSFSGSHLHPLPHPHPGTVPLIPRPGSRRVRQRRSASASMQRLKSQAARTHGARVAILTLGMHSFMNFCPPAPARCGDLTNVSGQYVIAKGEPCASAYRPCVWGPQGPSAESIRGRARSEVRGLLDLYAPNFSRAPLELASVRTRIGSLLRDGL